METGSADPYLLDPDDDMSHDDFVRGFARLPRKGEPRCGGTCPPEMLREMERNGWRGIVTDCILPPGHAPAGFRAAHNGLVVRPGHDPADAVTYTMVTWLATRRLGELVAR